jgi:MoxR-like ATPase
MSAELDKAIIDEDLAKLVIIGGLATQSATAFGGLAGGGKSTAVRAAFNLVEGVDYRKNVAFIPGDSELGSRSVIGGTYKQEKTISVDGQERLEITSSEAKGVFREDTVGVHYEEMAGMNQRTLRSSMSVIEAKKLERAGEIVDLENLFYTFISTNPSRVEDGTFNVPYPVKSRIVFGALMGLAYSDREARAEHNRRVRAIGKNPENKVNSVVNTPELLGMGEYLQGVAIAEGKNSVSELIGETAMNISDHLRREYDVRETDGRINIQLEQNAKVFAGLRNPSKAVEEKDVIDAAKSVVSARILTSSEIDRLTKDSFDSEVKDLIAA